MDGQQPRASRDDQHSAPTEPKLKQSRLTVQQQVAMTKAEQEANVIRDAAFAASMASALPIGSEVGPSGYKLYLDRLLKDAGNPTDPIEMLMVQQLALAHHRIARLHVQAEEAASVDSAKVYQVAAVRLTGEFRRLALALRQYRQPVSTKHFTVVQNQQIAYVAQNERIGIEDRVPSNGCGGELTSNRLTHAPADPLGSEIAKSSTSRRRTQEPDETKGLDCRGPQEAPAIHAEEPTLVAFNRTEDGCGEKEVGGERSQTPGV